jgi:iron-sulfur cluster assembly protein
MSTTQSVSHSIVSATPAAVDRWSHILHDQPQGSAIRLSVVGGGCAGLQYDMQPTATKADGDFVQRVNESVMLHIHPVAAAYLKGTEIDYSDAMIDGGFKFNNPNASSTCGCGTSFGV